MAAGRIVVEGFQPALALSGAPISGAKLFFYLNGTSTLTTVYTSATLLVAHTNPVIADSAGRFASIYADATLLFKVIVKDAADATLATYNDVRAIGSGAEVSTADIEAAVTALLPALVATKADQSALDTANSTLTGHIGSGGTAHASHSGSPSPTPDASDQVIEPPQHEH